MRRIISILFLSLLLLQAIPVLHFFSFQKEVYYSYIDEEKPGDTKEIKDGKEYLQVTHHALLSFEEENTYPPFFVIDTASPLLEYATPPPDAC